MPPESPIRYIVDRCRVWESLADTEAGRFSKPGPERALPIYTVDEPGCGLDDRMVAAVTIPPVGNFAKIVASNLVGVGIAPQTDTHGVGKSVTVITGRSAGTEAHSATQNRDYRHGDFVAVVASGCTGCRFTGTT